MKVAFYTLGCKVNQYETDLMKQKFLNEGYEIVNFDLVKKADVYVVNSCSVTNLATRKTRHYLSRAKKLNEDAIVVLAGCYSQEIDEDLKNSLNIDIVVGNEEKNDIVKYVNEYISLTGKQISDSKKIEKVYKVSDISGKRKYTSDSLLEKGTEIRESIKIEDGCNNFCSYCIIPYLRGRVRSKDINDIITEAENLVKSGVKELVVVGIEIASYGTDLENNVSLINVIEQIAKIDGLERIRLGSIEPRWLNDENIERLGKIEKLCNHFHISVQSLNNNVLKNMNRKYSREYIIELTKKLKKVIKDVSFTCDIIVGFPGETEEDFNNTIDAVKEIGFSELHVFKYSKRKFTKASEMKNQINEEIKNERSRTLIEVGDTLRKLYIKNYIGKKVEVLFESYKDGYLEGYTSNYIKVKVVGDRNLWGTRQEVELISFEKEVALGKLV
ncbi:MAG: tRNA (N(6)-L-threonylcarbamoyladenosine(37)-C(2))-methylthiotransferase MtaB [Clostridia bacterium]|nr:tRNA (N(6)-L-threonylcarbamoyladenosine(37)-C(2))-methylthiotransferase MtaB [Clostridia bacterium]